METRSNHVLVGAVTLALLAGLLVFIVWLAGLSNKTTKCFDILFQPRRSRGSTRARRSLSRAFRSARSSRSACCPTGPNSSGCGSRSMPKRRCSRAPPRQIKGVGFTGVSEIALDGAVKGGQPLTQVGPQGCPVIPASSGGLGALLNTAPELIDRIQRLTERLTELLVRQEPEFDLRHPRECREDHPACSPSARPTSPTRSAMRGSPPAMPASPPSGSACSPTAPPSWSTSRASPPPRICARRSPRCSAPTRQSRRGDRRRPARHSEFLQETLARGQPAGPRPARPVGIAARHSPSGSSRAASAARSGPKELPDYKPKDGR